MHGFYKANGGCGYVKKPDFMMQTCPDGNVFDPKADLPVKKTLKVGLWHMFLPFIFISEIQESSYLQLACLSTRSKYTWAKVGRATSSRHTSTRIPLQTSTQRYIEFYADAKRQQICKCKTEL